MDIASYDVGVCIDDKKNLQFHLQPNILMNGGNKAPDYKVRLEKTFQLKNITPHLKY